MNFNPATTVRLFGKLHRLIDNLHAGANRDVVEQIFNIVIPQANTPLTDAQPDTKISIGAMNSVQPADINRV